MSSTSSSTGHQAERRAAAYLAHQGFKLLDQNWKTRYCEIDIVCSKNNRMYFVEVKYRSNTKQGSGLDYITPRKLRQMHFAAELWVSNHDWSGDYQLAVISVDADHITFVDEL